MYCVGIIHLPVEENPWYDTEDCLFMRIIITVNEVKKNVSEHNSIMRIRGIEEASEVEKSPRNKQCSCKRKGL